MNDIGIETQIKKQPCMTDEVLKAMKERNELKSINEHRYRYLNRTIIRKCEMQGSSSRRDAVKLRNYSTSRIYKTSIKYRQNNRQKPQRNTGILKYSEKIPCGNNTSLFNDERKERPPMPTTLTHE